MTVQGGQEGVNKLREGLEAMQAYVASASQHFSAAFEQTQAAASPDLPVIENVQSATKQFSSLTHRREYLLATVRADIGDHIDRSGIAGLEEQNGYAEKALQAARTYDTQDAGLGQFLERLNALVAIMNEKLLASQTAILAAQEACGPLMEDGDHPVDGVHTSISSLLQKIDEYKGVQ